MSSAEPSDPPEDPRTEVCRGADPTPKGKPPKVKGKKGRKGDHSPSCPSPEGPAHPRPGAAHGGHFPDRVDVSQPRPKEEETA